eukprot:3200020-Pyramimonas_sp.AAC.1
MLALAPSPTSTELTRPVLHRRWIHFDTLPLLALLLRSLSNSRCLTPRPGMLGGRRARALPAETPSDDATD